MDGKAKVGRRVMGGKEDARASEEGDPVPKAADERARRLAEAMRANLRKRKEQQRAKRAPDPRTDG
jgi:hypothetical protein